MIIWELDIPGAFVHHPGKLVILRGLDKPVCGHTTSCLQNNQAGFLRAADLQVKGDAV